MKRNYLALLLLVTGSFNLAAQREITVEDIFVNGTFRTEGISNVRWMNDGQFFTALQQNHVVKYDITTGEIVDTVLYARELSPRITIQSYAFSRDENKLLLMSNRESVYRRSFKANYYVYDLNTEEMRELSGGGKQSYATFSPNGQFIAFTRDNDLYITDLSDFREKRISTDGERNKIINGSTDWVYEEELSFAKAFFWSPDSRHIAYYRFDESRVKTYNMQKWNKGQLYPEDYVFKYPKAGEENSEVKIFVYEVDSGARTEIDTGEETDMYIARVDWTNRPGILSLRRLNRLQNRLDILHADINTGFSEVIYSERSETYVELGDLIYLRNGEQFILSSEKDGYNHLYLYHFSGELVRQLTHGNWEVTRFAGVDESKRRPEIYFLAARKSHMDRGFYKTDIRARTITPLSPEEGFTDVDVSRDFSYYIRFYENANEAPRGELLDLQKNRVVDELFNNSEYFRVTEQYGFVPKEFFSCKAADGKTDLSGYMLKPHNLDEGARYPVLIFQYSGPGSQNVNHSWGGGTNFYWHQMLVQQGYLVAVVDTRGTGFRGAEFRKMTYGQLGKYEVEDHIAAARYLAGLPYIDENRIGIWGWSYGGYMSSLAILKGADVFSTAIAVAPVTNWRYYDTIYTERYMGLPRQNPSGYDDNSPTTHAGKLKGNFLLVHGTGDDNVHFQNSVALVDKLIQEGKDFDSFYYPDRAHSIYVDNARPHLFRMMTEFIRENL